METRRCALISGITGQDGSYLAELLLAKGYEVHGLVRRSSNFSTGRIEHLYHDQHERGLSLTLHYADILDTTSLVSVIARVSPTEIYNLAAQSHVAVSFEIPEYTTEVTGTGTLKILEALRRSGVSCRFYQAGSSEMFGQTTEAAQDEHTPFHPRSPYAIAKVFAHHTAVHYREAHGLYVANGILFNHESPRRGETFVTRKVTRGVAAIVAGKQEKLYLGNLDAKRDWGYAPEYVDAMWRTLQLEEPDDFVVATGESHSVREWVAAAFACVERDWREHVEHDPRYDRRTEVDFLLGDAARARKALEWVPTTTFHPLVRLMVEADLKAAGLNPADVMRPQAEG